MMLVHLFYLVCLEICTKTNKRHHDTPHASLQFAVYGSYFNLVEQRASHTSKAQRLPGGPGCSFLCLTFRVWFVSRLIDKSLWILSSGPRLVICL